MSEIREKYHALFVQNQIISRASRQGKLQINPCEIAN